MLKFVSSANWWYEYTYRRKSADVEQRVSHEQLVVLHGKPEDPENHRYHRVSDYIVVP